MMGQPHDSVFKYTFSAPERAAEELRAVLPSEVIARVDWSTLKLEPGEFVDEELRRESTDLLFSAHVAGRPVGAAPHGLDALGAVGRYLVEVSDHVTKTS